LTAQIKTAVVTGAAQGIGRRTAEVLGAKGYTLILNDLQSCAEVASTIEELGQKAVEVRGDVSDEAVAQRIAESARSQFGRADVLVNNAAIAHICPAEKIGTAEWRRVQDVNLLGPFLLSREIGVMMLEQGLGSIINIASIAGLLAVADRAA
jgi:NAD(P)-dependent dehydrogenase (short-subunit alcohol dehydrogenase family)